MNRTLRPLLFLLLLLSQSAFSKDKKESGPVYDVGVLMATPGGIAAAVSAARMGMKVVLIERTRHIGGLPANGLGATDIATKELASGFFKEFTDSILSYYQHRYGAGSPQVKDCARGFHFEPIVAEVVFNTLLKKEKNLTLLTGFQFDALAENVRGTDTSRFRSIRVCKTDKPRKKSWLSARIWIDGSYEGDLAAAMGCRFRTYREGKAEFGEPMAGKIYKIWASDTLEPGSTGEADSAIQAFNYRLCITRNPENRVAIARPKEYNREEFVSLADDLRRGWLSGFFPKNGKTAGIVNPVKLPNGKYDANNHHRGLVSTDLPEENWPYPTADWKWRDRFALRLRSYILGLLYFSQNDTLLPLDFRREALEYGLAKDEYPDNDHFPRQLYVREGRRVEGKHMFTAHDALPEHPGHRPPAHRTTVVSSHYAIDSHAMHKREKGRKTLDGFISYHTQPFSVPYEVMVPIGKESLLCPVPVSASHVGYGCLRMEPCWMGLGHAAGVAAALSLKMGCIPSGLPIDTLQATLLTQKANLMYVQDVGLKHPDYAMVQLAALRGWIPTFEARLDETVSNQDLELWAAKTGFSVDEVALNAKDRTRREALYGLLAKYAAAHPVKPGK